VRDVWPGFISCVLAVHEEVIRTRRDEVLRLVDGIREERQWARYEHG
jgi:NitT/TauT family transport system substrate-binding protein